MPDITNQRAVAFVNNEMRPIAETLRDLSNRIESIQVQWTLEVQALIPNDPLSLVVDNRENEGISRLNGQDIRRLMTVITNIRTSLQEAGVANTIAKPCVRTLPIG